MTTPGNVGERYSTLLSRLLDSQQWERALAVAREWLALDPEALPAHRAAAQALVNGAQEAQAIPHLQKMLEANPDDPFAHHLAAMAWFYRGDYVRADKHIGEAIRLQPRSATNWYHRAWMRYRLGLRGKAVRDGRRALELAPNRAEIINLLAVCELDDDRKLSYYQRALELDPASATAHQNLGAHYLHRCRDFPRAEESFRRALALNPGHKAAERGLLLALRESDPIYCALRWPQRFRAAFERVNGEPGTLRATFALLLFGCLGPVWVALYLLWLIGGLPLLRGYEFLPSRDVHAQAGVLGARRGGWLNAWRWPRGLRVGAFFLAYAASWSGIFLGVSTGRWWLWLPGLLVIMVFAFVGDDGKAAARDMRHLFSTWKRERAFRRNLPVSDW